MITRLVLHNYRVYEDLDMTFDNLQIIKGRNGIGKTSIVEAIGFAMFGSALQRGKAGSWIKKGKKDGHVVLYLDSYIIRRSPTLATVEQLDGKIVARNNTGIVEWIEKEFGLTAELYKTSFYIGQKDIGAFAALGPLERTKRVEKLLRIDRLDEIKNKAKEVARAVQGSLNVYVSKLEGSDYNAKLLEDSQQTARNLDALLLDLGLKHEKLLVASGKYSQQLILWDRKQSLLKAFTGEIENLEQLEKEYEAMVERNATVDSYNKLVNEKASLEKILSSVIVLPKYFNYNLIDLVTQEKDIKALNLLKVELDKLNCKSVNHDLDKLRLDLKALEKEYGLNVNIPKNCPTCKQSWPVEPVDIKLILKEISALTDTLDQAKREQRAYEITQQIFEPEMSYTEVTKAISSVTHKDNYLKLQKLEEYKELKTKEIFRVDIIKAREQKTIAIRLKELGDVTEPTKIDLAPIKTEIDKANIKFKGVHITLRKQMEYKAIEEEFTDLKNDADEHLENLKSFIKFIDKYRKAFGANVIPLLEQNVSNIVSYLSEGKYDKIKINPDYGVDDFEYYSGSEQDSINFALRLAIAQVSKLGNFNTMLLDEIAASFDTERETLLMDILKQQSNQLIYITHGEL